MKNVLLALSATCLVLLMLRLVPLRMRGHHRHALASQFLADDACAEWTSALDSDAGTSTWSHRYRSIWLVQDAAHRRSDPAWVREMSHAVAEAQALGIGSAGPVLYLQMRSQGATTVEIRSAAPTGSLDEWEHVAEGSVTLSSGQLRFQAAPLDGSVNFLSPCVRVPPGTYRVRSLTRVRPGSTLEHSLVLWPAPPSASKLLRGAHFDPP